MRKRGEGFSLGGFCPYRFELRTGFGLGDEPYAREEASRSACFEGAACSEACGDREEHRDDGLRESYMATTLGRRCLRPMGTGRGPAHDVGDGGPRAGRHCAVADRGVFSDFSLIHRSCEFASGQIYAKIGDAARSGGFRRVPGRAEAVSATPRRELFPERACADLLVSEKGADMKKSRPQ
jgi:hypothetical protein